nr:hypothetical protein [Tanacetum cinerariifolium]
MHLADPSQSWLGSPKDTNLLFDVQGNPQQALKDKGVIDSGCSRYMTGNISYLSDFEEINGRYVAFGGNPKGGVIDSGCSRYMTGNISYLSDFEEINGRYVAFGGNPKGGVRDLSDESEEFFVNSTNRVNAASAPVTADGPNSTNNNNSFNAAGPFDTIVSPTFEIDRKSSFVDPSQCPDDPNMPALEDIIYSDDEEDVGAEADFSNLETNRSMASMVKEQGGLTQINNEDIHTYMFACFLSQEEPKRVHHALKDPSWIEAMQEELLQFKMQKGHTQEEDIDYEDVFAPVAKIEVISLFLAYASFMGFLVYQMDIKNAFLYRTIKEKVYVCQPPGFEDPDYPDKVYKVSSMGELTFFLGLQVKQKDNGIFISQDKYVTKILRKFGLTDGKSASTPIDTGKPLLKDPDGEDVDVHIY